MEHLHDKFMKDKREIARNWTVQTKNGPIEISVDTAYTDKASVWWPAQNHFCI